jgi:hypothetical protein
LNKIVPYKMKKRWVNQKRNLQKLL